MLIKTLGALVCAATMLLSPVPVLATETTSTPAPTYSPPRGVYVVGDSITVLGAPHLAALRPGWFVYGLGGRNVDAIPRMVDNVLSLNPNPRAIVIALGTNASDAWTRDQFAAALNKIPWTTKVALVTTYRDPTIFDPLFSIVGSREYFQPIYTRWMQLFAHYRHNTCVVPWRGVVLNIPGLLYDGVHPNATGRAIWARTVVRSVDSCV